MCEKVHSESGTEMLFNPCDEYNELKKKYNEVLYERDVYKTVLVAYGYRNVDQIPIYGMDWAKLIGKTTKEMTVKIIEELDEIKKLIYRK